MTTNTKLFDGVIIFSQVVNSGGFSAAAEVIGHSTSYISKEVTKLEARLGARLLNRTTRSISLTPEGNVYFQQCQQMIADAEQALGVLTEGNVTPRGVLKISCPVDFGLGYLQPILSAFIKKHPKVTLDLDLNDRKVDVVQDGFDIAIRATNQLEESSLICRKIYSCKSYVVATPEYLNNHGRPTTPEQLKHHSCICYTNKKTPNIWDFKDKSGNEEQVEVPQTILCNSSQMKIAMLLEHHGICRLPAFTMDRELANNKLEILFQNYQATDINVYAVYPSRKHLSPKIRIFIDMLVDKLA